MNQFCQECGTPAVEGELRCRNCGAELQREKEELIRVAKKPMSKKQKIVRGAIGILALMLVGFSLWANSYHSAESVKKRFSDAILAKDIDKIRSLSVHEDGSEIRSGEAEAFLKLVTLSGENTVQRLTSVVQHGKFLGMYKKHKVEMVNQFVYHDSVAEGLIFTFNSEEIKRFDSDGYGVTFGPVSPGIYEVEAIFEGAYGTATKKGSVTLASNDSEDQWIGMDIYIAHVIFEIEDWYGVDEIEAYVLFNEEKLPINEYGETDAIGPLLIDGSQTAKIVLTMPWGEISSEEIAIDSEYTIMTPTIISETEYKKVVDVLKNYGEQYAESFASRSVDPFTTITESMAEYVEEDLFYLLRNDYYHSGSFDSLAIDRNSIEFYEDEKDSGIRLQTRFFFQSSLHELTEEPMLSENIDDRDILLFYDEETTEWKVELAISTNFWEFDSTDEFEGSGNLYKPSADLVDQQKKAMVNEEIGQFMSEFHERGVQAINTRNFGYVEEYHTTDGKSLKESRDYIDYLETKGITEEHLGTTVEKVEQVDESTWKVTSIDQFVIIKEDSQSEKTFRSVTILKNIDGTFKMHELVSTEEI